MTKYAEDIGHYWKTSTTAPDTWIDKAKAEIGAAGGKVLSEAFGSDAQGCAAFMLAFSFGDEQFKAVWPVLPTRRAQDARAARVQDISEADAWAEGAHIIARRLPYSGDDLGYMAFSGLWEQINAKRGYSWDGNPWVWVVEFKRVQP